MEDNIYADLDNYNEADVAEELTRLRNENRDLKQKIEEYASAMTKLQKDFDELASEFKKLEMNYSSLLKTARSEIERKTQIITNLNIEKDTIVLNAIHNKNYFEARKIMGKSCFDTQSNSDPRVWRKERDQKTKTSTEKAKDECRQKCSNDHMTKLEDSRNVNLEKSQMFENMYGETKENNNSKVHPMKASRISNRRKSMPALRCEDELQISENEYEHPMKQYHSRNNLSPDQRESRSKHRSGRGSETSSTEEKYSSYKESSLETYYKSRYNTYNSEHRRNRHRYEGDIHRKHSPDRLLRKATRNHAEIQKHENRQSDNSYYTRYGQRSRSRDCRSYYDTSKENHRKHHLPDRFPGKHKIQDNYSGNCSKRIKHSNTSRYPEEQNWQQEKYYTDEELFQKVIGDIQYTSCQSPDMSFECSAQPVKEIKLNAEFGSTPEDPRIRSRKYSFKTDDEKTVLATVASEWVDLKPINKSIWNIENIKMPEALQHPPPQVLQHPPPQVLADTLEQNDEVSDVPEVVCNIYSNSNIKNNDEETRNSNETLNPQLFKSSQEDFENKTTKYKIPKLKKLDQTVKNDKQITSLKNKNPNLEDKTLTKEPENSTKSSDLTESIYDQIYTPETNISIEEGEIDDSDDLLLTGLTPAGSKSDVKIETHKPYKNTQNESKPAHAHLITSKQDMSESKERNSKISLKNTENVNIKVINTINTKDNERKSDRRHSNDSSKVKLKVSKGIALRSGTYKGLTNKELVAGDLELSEESNDDRDFPKPFEVDIKLNEPPSNAKLLPDSRPISEKNLTSKLSEAELDKAKANVKSPDLERKTKGKRKSKKSNLSTKKHTKNSDPTIKKAKQSAVKDTVSTPIKNKFSDLFGDSSSLITPEDLGLATVSSEHVAMNYGPVIEDAQDATDLNTIKEPLRLEVETQVRHIEENQNCYKDSCLNAQSKSFDAPVNTNVNEIIPYVSKNKDESDVIQTVVISTGTQPQFTVPVASSDVPDILSQANVIAERRAMTALATSTPHKSLNELNAKLPDVSCSNSNDSRSSSNNPSICEKLLSVESQNDDVPDVRIFVKRKRRVIKKTA